MDLFERWIFLLWAISGYVYFVCVFLGIGMGDDKKK